LWERKIIMGDKDKKGQLTVNSKWCKGCSVCVQYCPKKVLEVHRGKVVIARPEDCTKCGLCEMRCPDYAIYFRREKDE